MLTIDPLAFASAGRQATAMRMAPVEVDVDDTGKLPRIALPPQPEHAGGVDQGIESSKLAANAATAAVSVTSRLVTPPAETRSTPVT